MWYRIAGSIAVWALLVTAAIGTLPADLIGRVEASTTCTHNFTSNVLKWCVNEHGNLRQLESPSGAQHMGLTIEGYYICLGETSVPYYDSGPQHGGFGDPTVIGGPTSSSVTIRRTTLDGRFVFDQKWTRDTTERDVTVQMTLQNDGPAATDVRLFRVVDINANGTATNFFDASRYSGIFRNLDGVVVTALTLNASPSIVMNTNFGGIIFCNPATATVPGSNNAKVYVRYDLGNLGTGKKKTVKVGYRVM